MSDFLLELGQNPTARKVIKTLNLPVPTPQDLARAKQPWEEQPLQGNTVVVGGNPNSKMSETVLSILKGAGADKAVMMGYGDDSAQFSAAGKAVDFKPEIFAPHATPKNLKVNAIVFDGTGLRTAAELESVYACFNPWMRKLAPNARLVVLATLPQGTDDIREAACGRGLEGLVRALGKEVGKKGSTANVVYVEPGAEDRVEPVLRYVLSKRSAFVSGQPFTVTKTAKAPKSTPTVQPLAGKTALVTGGARGIGAATAELLAAEGAHVVILDLPCDELNETAAKLNGTPLPGDISRDEAPEEIATFLKEKFGGVDIVVHNAGVTRDKTMAGMKPHLWNMVMQINLGAVIRLDEVLLDTKTINAEGRMVYLASISGIGGNMGQTNYALSKAGIIGYVQAQSPKVAAQGITMNAVAPGFIETRMTAAIPFAIREVGRRLNSLSQGGQPSDVGDLITFLSSPGSAGVTGNVIRCCGQNLMGA